MSLITNKAANVSSSFLEVTSQSVESIKPQSILSRDITSAKTITLWNRLNFLEHTQLFNNTRQNLVYLGLVLTTAIITYVFVRLFSKSTPIKSQTFNPDENLGNQSKIEELKKALQNQEDESKRLQQEISNKQNEIKTTQDTSLNLGKDLKNLEYEKENEIKELKEEKEKIVAELKTAKTTSEEQGIQTRKLQSERDEQAAKVLSLQTKIQELKNTIDKSLELDKDAKKLESEKENLTLYIGRLQTDLEKKEKEIKELKEEIKRKVKELIKGQTEEIEKIVVELKTAKEKEIKELKEEIERIKTELKTAKTASEEQEIQTQKLQSERDEQAAKVLLLQTKIQELKNTIDKQKDFNDVLCLAIDLWKEREQNKCQEAFNKRMNLEGLLLKDRKNIEKLFSVSKPVDEITFTNDELEILLIYFKWSLTGLEKKELEFFKKSYMKLQEEQRSFFAKIIDKTDDFDNYFDDRKYRIFDALLDRNNEVKNFLCVYIDKILSTLMERERTHVVIEYEEAPFPIQIETDSEEELTDSEEESTDSESEEVEENIPPPPPPPIQTNSEVEKLPFETDSKKLEEKVSLLSNNNNDFTKDLLSVKLKSASSRILNPVKKTSNNLFDILKAKFAKANGEGENKEEDE